MEDREFTKDMYKLYVAQRKKLDDLVPKSVREQYIKKEKNYEEFKEKQKERYKKRVEEGGEEFRQKIREKNNASYRRKKEREAAESKEIPESISRYSSSITQSNYSVDDSEEDLESVFTDDVQSYEAPQVVTLKGRPQDVTPRFIGF
jgi:mannitol-1-phosphate/altronate dehydrogenase